MALAAALYSAVPETCAPGAVLAAWLAGPVIGWWISRPLSGACFRLPTLNGFSWGAWPVASGPISKFVGAGDNWLPPDNFQEFPGPLVASRTSPTNLGMNLQANLAASDLGYIS